MTAWIIVNFLIEKCAAKAAMAATVPTLLYNTGGGIKYRSDHAIITNRAQVVAIVLAFRFRVYGLGLGFSV